MKHKVEQGKLQINCAVSMDTASFNLIHIRSVNLLCLVQNIINSENTLCLKSADNNANRVLNNCSTIFTLTPNFADKGGNNVLPFVSETMSSVDKSLNHLYTHLNIQRRSP